MSILSKSCIGILLFFALSGCTRNQSVDFHGSERQEPVGSGTVIREMFGDKVWIVVWYDISQQGSNSISGGSTSTGTGRVEQRYSQTSNDGRKLDIRLVTDNDGSTGEAEINGERFRVERGRVFLVSTKGAQPGTTQIQVDLDKFRPSAENLDKLAEAHPGIKEFVARLKQ